MRSAPHLGARNEEVVAVNVGAIHVGELRVGGAADLAGHGSGERPLGPGLTPCTHGGRGWFAVRGRGEYERGLLWE